MQITRDPVCGTELEMAVAEMAGLFSDLAIQCSSLGSPIDRSEIRRFHFCSPDCKRRFDLAPGFYSALAPDGEQPPGQRL